MSTFYAPRDMRAEIYRNIAGIFVAEPVVVSLVPSLSNHGEGWGGEVYWKGGQYVIELLDRLPTNTERDVFLHELGHVAQGHIEKKDVEPYSLLDQGQQQNAIRGELFAEAQAEYDRHEQEANAWSKAAYTVLKREKKIW